LTVEAVNDFSARLDERRLEHVGQQRKDRVERRKLGVGIFAILDASKEFGEDGQVENEGSSKEGIL
jgi:hypothetical protein